MNKKIALGVALGLTVFASSCFAQVVYKDEVYKGNEIKIENAWNQAQTQLQNRCS